MNYDFNMPERDSSTVSIWQESVEPQSFSSGTDVEHTVFDVIIIGGGITGITTALLLQEAGKKCIILEGNTLGFGTTGGTTAHLNTFFDTSYPEIDQDFGTETSKLMADAGKTAIEIIKGFVEKYNIDCDFEYKDAYLYAENEKENKQLLEILESSRAAGVQVVEERDNGVPVPFEASLLFKDQAQFHSLKYVFRLAEEFVKQGGIILQNTFVRDISNENGIAIANADAISVKGQNLCYATHVPPGINLLHFRCAPYRSYVLAATLRDDDDYPEKLIYDMQEPYHYFRTHIINGKKYLILGGEDHKTGHEDPENAFENLEAYARKYYRVESVDYKWSSQYYVPADGLPYIGNLPGAEENVYVATGFNGNGMVFGTLSARIISDQILQNENQYIKLFSPSRIKPIAGFSEFVKENADVAYHFIADRFSAKDIDSLIDLKPEQGMIVDYQDQKLAVYKDVTGNVKALNPVCTHAGCIVKFNEAEKSWDCPCHGGRFNLDGQVLNGPPTTDLERITIQ